MTRHPFTTTHPEPNARPHQTHALATTRPNDGTWSVGGYVALAAVSAA